MTPAVERRVAAARGRIAARVRDLLPDARVEEGADGVTVSARVTPRIASANPSRGTPSRMSASTEPYREGSPRYVANASATSR